MNNQEREVIQDIFQRLEQAANQPRDPEAERFIADKIRQQPYAPYAMAQMVYVQEQALQSLQAQIQELQAEVEDLRRRPQQSGGFLSAIFGGGRQPEPPRRGGSFGQPGMPPQGMPMQQGGFGGQQGYGQPGFGQPGMGQPGMGQPGMGAGPWGGQPRAGGGFLGTALTTAAGVAGGMMLASALSSAFAGGHQTLGALGGDAASAAGGDAGGLGGITDSLYQGGGGGDASFQNASFGDQADLGGGADFSDGGGGDFDMGGDEY